ncbi:MAG: phosphatase PAP2 family protein [Planctomycetes bacterium]|nr:phosphatase PAP2 family protein [Planctomycetota bacterium]
MRRRIPWPILAVIAVGCASADPSREQGGRRPLLPSLEHVGRSALHAALDPGTWIPAAGAIVFTADRFDRRVSDWASKKTPIFGSTSSARDASDPLLIALAATTVASAIAVPVEEGDGSWPLAKLETFAVEGGSVLAAEGLTEGLKGVVGRGRPIGRSTNSFPSGHATAGFALATSTARNLDAIDVPRGVRFGLQAGTYGTAGALAWARVEGLNHFPSDVLAGAAIGHFFAAFLHEAFLGRTRRAAEVETHVFATSREAVILVGLRF